MKSKLRTGKRVLAVVMAIFMVMTAWVFVAPEKAEAASYKAQNKTMGDLMFVVPEAIYCYPDAAAQAWEGTHRFQYYVNNNTNGTAATAYSTTGTIYYSYAGASSATISWVFVNSDLTSTVGGGSVSLSSSSISSGGTVSINGGTTPSLAAATNGTWIQWTLSYTDSVDGIAKKVYAYTYVYKPYTIPVAAGADAGTGTSGGANWAGIATWINGFHSLTEVSGDLASDWDDRYNLYTNMSNFSCFVNQDSTGYVNGTAYTGSQAKITSYSYTTTGYSTGYALFANSSGSGYYFNHAPNNSNPSYLGSGSSGTYTSPVRNYRVGKYRKNTKNVQACVVTNTYGNITIDTSRYTNLNQIPNVSIGMTVTDDESSGSNTGTWYIADYTDRTCSGYDTWHTDSDDRSKYYSDYGYRIAGQGTGPTDCSFNETEGIRYAGKWPRTLLGSTGTQDATYMYMAKGFYGNKDGGWYASSHCVVKMNATYRNKSNLRSAVYSAMKKFPALGVNNISGGYIKSCYFDDDSNYKWTAFRNAYRAAYRALVTLDDTNNMNTLASNLTNALNALCTKVTFNANGGSFTSGSATQYITIGAAQRVAITFSNYANVSRTGYIFKGWKEANASAAQTTSDTIGYNYAYTAQWEPIAYTVIFNANGGTGTMSNQSRKYDDGASLTANGFAKEGHDFTGWNTAANGTGTSYANRATGNLTSTAGNVTLYAQWKINQYPVIFKNGDTTIQTTYLNYGTTVTSTTYDNPTPTKPYDTENHYIYTGWSPALHPVAASDTGNIYTASFRTEAHDYLRTQYTASTCTTNGTQTLKCNCGYTKTETLVAPGHNWDEGVVTMPATCKRTGEKMFTCDTCGETRDEIIPINPDAHVYPATWKTRTEATCTEKGLQYKKCSYCQNEITQETPALGHDEVTHEAQAATCLEIGWNAYVTCSRCDYTTYEELPALGHDEVNHEAQAPTCTEIGWNAYVTCSRCEYTTYNELAALGHNEVNHEGKAATCLEGGWKAYVTCTNCDYTTYEAINALGHDIVNHEAQAPTCLVIGWDAYETCKRCEYTTYSALSALGHDIVNHEAKVPTCTEIGWDAYVTCSRCDYTTYEEIAALGHNEVNHEGKAATCLEGGWKAYVTCTRCDYTTYEAINALGHDIVNHEAKAPTCLEIGWDAYETCTRCDYTTYNELPALGHDEVTHEAKAATCTEIGWDAYVTCSRCDYTTYNEIAALGHDKVTHEAQAATCLEIGWDAYVTCTRCDYTTYNEIAALGHNKVSHEAKAPTCTEIGWDAYETCKRCDYTTYNEIAALGHDEVNHEAQAATCLEIGWDAYVTCTRCDYTTYNEIAALGHDEVNHEAQAATCLEIGWDAYVTCTRCDYTTYNEIAALGHDITTYEAQAATCAAAGWNEYESCSRCDYTTYVEIPALDHDLVSHEAKAPTCTEIGWDAYETCTRCDYTTYNEIAALGHDEVAHEGKAATCLEGGWDAYVTCTRCDYTTYNALEALGHDITSYEAKAATCGEDGWNAYESCSRCDYTTYEAIAALGHDEVNHEAKAPTCTEIGWDAYVTCTRCDYTTYNEIAALGHDEVAHEAKAATCTEIGWDAYVTCTRCDYTTYNEIAALGHDEVSLEAKAATCLEGGWNAYVTCTRCDYTTYEAIAALGHTNMPAVVEGKVDSTCDKEGSYDEVVYCSVCGDEVSRVTKTIEKKPHTIVVVEGTPATCQAEGMTDGRYCSACGEVFAVQEVIPVKEHNIVTVKGRPATCTTEGSSDKIYCVDCGTIIQASTTTPATGHVMGDKSLTKTATCTKDGVMEYKCKVCKTVMKTESVPAFGHDFGEGEVIEKPTTTKEGKKKFTCRICGNSYTETLPMLSESSYCANPIGAICESYNKYAETPFIGFVVGILHVIYHFLHK